MSVHKIFYQDSKCMDEIHDESIDLMITSPPYPMIEMWDDIFIKQNKEIAEAFDNEEQSKAFELMHAILDEVWSECFRVLRKGGIACINIGDATRTINDNFQLFNNHSRITNACLKLGFQNLPNIIWRKQTNAPNKFMGSGMLPPGAYVTLEHEHILVFRKEGKREFAKDEEKNKRRESSFFWEERNVWFSDIWEIKGTNQRLNNKKIRARSAAYPFEIPYRLINMFSVQGDVILDPFVGTGSSTLAAIASDRNSVGFEIDSNFAQTIVETVLNKENELNNYVKKRIMNHLNFVEERLKAKGNDYFKYRNRNFEFPVMTKQETEIKIQYVKKVLNEGNEFIAKYHPDAAITPPDLSNYE